MPVPDKELERMVKNLQKAFNDASAGYEVYRDVYGASNDVTRQRAAELAAISQAYLAAVAEQDERADAKDRPKLVKVLKNP
jgi:hypothetical protein